MNSFTQIQGVVIQEIHCIEMFLTEFLSFIKILNYLSLGAATDNERDFGLFQKQGLVPNIMRAWFFLFVSPLTCI